LRRDVGRHTLLRIAALAIGLGLLGLSLHYWTFVASVSFWLWSRYSAHRDDIAPFLTPAAALVAALVAFGQFRIARLRHEEQTNADRQRRITESYSMAVEQLASESPLVRLGGIFSLERISVESSDDYWTVMETLTAFVRERARCTEADTPLSASIARLYVDATSEERAADGLPTDIAAALTVICRRDPRNYQREKKKGWMFDLQNTDLRRASLLGARLERANLAGAHLEEATLVAAHLAFADLRRAHLDGADLGGADLELAHLNGAHLRGTRLSGAHLSGAWLEDVDLRKATGLKARQVVLAHGNATTRLPDGVVRGWPWPPEQPEEEPDVG
jgi:uncharacterized protein YjbI with pentapeptide repeats